MAWLDKINHPERYLKTFLKWSFFGLLMGALGGIIYLIMQFIWTGDTKKEDTFRNWAKAQLIVTLVVVILSIILIAIFGLSIADIAINVN